VVQASVLVIWEVLRTEGLGVVRQNVGAAAAASDSTYFDGACC
jgi:hypothetical protein